MASIVVRRYTRLSLRKTVWKVAESHGRSSLGLRGAANSITYPIAAGPIPKFTTDTVDSFCAATHRKGTKSGVTRLQCGIALKGAQ